MARLGCLVIIPFASFSWHYMGDPVTRKKTFFPDLSFNLFMFAGFYLLEKGEN